MSTAADRGRMSIARAAKIKLRKGLNDIVFRGTNDCKSLNFQRFARIKRYHDMN